MVAVAVSQPRMLRIAPSVAAQQLATAENYADRALQLLEGLPKRANETDAQLRKRKSALAADAHTALAMVHMYRDELSKAIEELRTAISLSEVSNPQLYFRLGEVYADYGKKAEAIEAFTKASELGRGTVLQKHAEERIQALKK
jgi:tetratricopeptide (TPR) repeat protein